MSTAEEVIDTLLAADLASVQRELRQLRAIRDWAVQQAADFGPGDRVIIDGAIPIGATSGWHTYREALAHGATATVQRIGFDAHRGRWYAEVQLDREWTVNLWADGVRRFWHGPAADTPTGMEPPSKYDQEHHPDGRRHVFMLNVHWLRSAEQPERNDRG